MKPLKLLTARSTVIALFAAFTASLLGALLIPQRGADGNAPAWLGRLPESLRPGAGWLGLDNIVGSGWFVVLVALCSLSLARSTVSQFSAARAMANRAPRETATPEGVRLELGLQAFAARLSAAGFRHAGSSGSTQRYVKFRSGYWGNFLLHLGMVTAIVFSLIFVVTRDRVYLRLVDQELTRFVPGTFDEVLGMRWFRQRLPEAVQLSSLEPAFWGNDRLASLSSQLNIIDHPGDQPRRVAIALSDKSHFGPFTVYQANSFGVACDLAVYGPEQPITQERLFLPYPAGREKASYSEKVLKESGLLLKAKFYADADKKAMQLRSPLLTLRLYRGKELLGETSLRRGQSGEIGPYLFRLSQTQWWTAILLDGSRGMSGIFTGFAILLAGVLSSYCLVPREITVREAGGALYVQPLVRRFAQFYREEFDDLLAAARKSEES